MKQIPIRELQLMKLKVLKIIDNICRQENISYFLAYGTLIGAVREQGFVPWDQDIDLMMLREDYIRFNRVANKYLPKNEYFLQNYETEKNMIAPITRICIKGTYRASQSLGHLDYEKGSFVDIFPIDYSSSKCYVKQYVCCRKLYKKILFKESRPISKSLVKRFLKSTLRFFSRIIPTKQNKKLLVKLMQKNSSSREMLVDFAGEYGYDKESFDPNWFYTSVYLKFEDQEFPCPIGYDRILTQIYGDYMVRPPVEKQKADLPSFYLNE